MVVMMGFVLYFFSFLLFFLFGFLTGQVKNTVVSRFLAVELSIVCSVLIYMYGVRFLSGVYLMRLTMLIPCIPFGTAAGHLAAMADKKSKQK